MFVSLRLGKFLDVKSSVKAQLRYVGVSHLSSDLYLLLQLEPVGDVVPGHVEHLGGQGALHVQVQGGGAVEAGRDVDLQQPRLQLGVQEDVETKQFKTRIFTCYIGVM